MSDIFQISVTALQAFQTAINTTSNNIANASTPGYDVETANLTEAVPQSNGTATVGSGVQVSGISRAYSQAATNQLNTSQSTLAQLNAVQNYSTQIDNDFGTNLGGLSTAIQTFYSAASTVANAPTSSAARQAFLNDAQGVAGSFQSASSQLNDLNTDVNSRINTDVTQINSIAATIAKLNQQIESSTAQAGGQVPNELLDQRDQQISSLSQLVGVTTTTQADGAVNVFIGNGGQALVLEDQSHDLTTVPSQFNASQLEVGSTTVTGSISNQITSGDLGGLLQARSQVINPALSQLGQIATTLSQTVNAQQAQGLDLNGNFGAAIFSVGAPTATPSSANKDGTSATVSLNAGGLGQLSSDNYILSYRNGAYTLADQTTGTNVNFTAGGTAAAPTISANGITITLSGTPAAGDEFLVQPTLNAASTFNAVLTDPSKVAAAGILKSSASNANAGSGSISSPTVLNVANAALQTPATIAFTSATTYTINGGAAQTLAANGQIAANGWQVTLSGTPVAGDTFTVQSNAGGSGDNTNALALAAGQSAGVLNGGTVSVTGAASALITNLGSQAQQIATAQTAQAAINTQASNAVQSVSGVNLDEEAANLLKWQQAYQAAAQALAIGNTLFTTLINAVNGGAAS